MYDIVLENIDSEFFILLQHYRAIDHEQPEPTGAWQFTVVNGISGATVEYLRNICDQRHERRGQQGVVDHQGRHAHTIRARLLQHANVRIFY